MIRATEPPVGENLAKLGTRCKLFTVEGYRRCENSWLAIAWAFPERSTWNSEWGLPRQRSTWNFAVRNYASGGSFCLAPTKRNRCKDLGIGIGSRPLHPSTFLISAM